MKQVFIIIATIFCINSLHAQNKALDSVIKAYQLKYNFNGVVVISHNGKTSFLNALGIANRADSALIKPASKFKIASITKTFTAVIIMQLIEEKKLHLEDTIGKYLPSYTGEAKSKVTIYNLLTYSSGIPNCDGDSGMAVYQRRLSIDDFITKNCSGNLHFTPGSQFEYNNVDYILLGKIIETVTGKSFTQNLQQRILQPLQMHNTGMLSDTDIVYNLVASYTHNDSTKMFYTDEPYYSSNFSAAKCNRTNYQITTTTELDANSANYCIK